MTVQLTGFAELDRKLVELSRAAGKGTLRRALKKSAQPVADAANRAAPDDPRTTKNDLRGSVVVGTKLSKRDAAQHRKAIGDDRSSVEMFIGPVASVYPKAMLQEFGTRHHAPQPYMRPAWEAGKDKLLDDLGRNLAVEIDKAIGRAVRRAAKLSKG